MPVIFMYSPPAIPLFVFECDCLPGSCSLAPWLPASWLELPASCSGFLLLQGSGCRAQASGVEHSWMDLRSKLGCSENSSCMQVCPATVPILGLGLTYPF